MNRFDKIAEQLDDYLFKQINFTLDSANVEFQQHKNIYVQSFQKCLSDCIVQADLFQKQGKKGAIKYLSISTLQSNLLTETYKIRIHLQDSQGWLDLSESYSDWIPEFILPYLNLDNRAIQTELSGKVVRIKPYELFEIQHTYRSLIFHYLAYFISELAEQSGTMLKVLDCEAEVFVLYGNYMEKNGYISKIQMEELEDSQLLLS